MTLREDAMKNSYSTGSLSYNLDHKLGPWRGYQVYEYASDTLLNVRIGELGDIVVVRRVDLDINPISSSWRRRKIFLDYV